MTAPFVKILTSIETTNTLRYLPLHVVKNWVGVGVGGDVLPVGGHPERDHVLPERPGHSVLAQPGGLVLLCSPRARHGDLHALVAVVGPEGENLSSLHRTGFTESLTSRSGRS